MDVDLDLPGPWQASRSQAAYGGDRKRQRIARV